MPEEIKEPTEAQLFLEARIRELTRKRTEAALKTITGRLYTELKMIVLQESRQQCESPFSTHMANWKASVREFCRRLADGEDMPLPQYTRERINAQVTAHIMAELDAVASGSADELTAALKRVAELEQEIERITKRRTRTGKRAEATE